MDSPTVTIAVEGDLDAAVARRLLAAVSLATGVIHVRGGKHRIDKGAGGFNRAAAHGRWLVLRDLDHDAECGPRLMSQLLPRPAPMMCFRVVVRAVEAWLLADQERVASWLRISPDSVPRAPETLSDPKATLVQLAGRSRSRILCKEMTPAPGARIKVGPGYTAATIEFVTTLWRPRTAALHSPSLAGCLRRLEQ